MEEVWKDIRDYEGLYQISNCGRVKRLEKIVHRSFGKSFMVKEIVMKNWKCTNEYIAISLIKDGIKKNKLIHRLVAEAFIENTDDLPEINHKDEDRSNNNVINLEWCTHEYNNNYGTRLERISKKQKRKPVIQMDMDGNIIKEYSSTLEVSTTTGFNRANIIETCRGKYKQAYGYTWRFAYDDRV